MQVTRYGPDAWLLRFAEVADEAAFRLARRLVDALQRQPPTGLTEFVPAFTTLLLRFAPDTLPSAEELTRRLGGWRADASEAVSDGRLVELPVHYAGPDLLRVGAQAGLPAAEVISLHAGATYRVHCVGFAPGFPYLGGLAPRLHTPRLTTPRLRVPPGSVAIGGEHTGIYSVASPGGWNLIGQTNARLFDPRAGRVEDMFLLQAGDQVRFRPVEAMAPAELNSVTMEPGSGPPLLRVVAVGLGLSLQDPGRAGFGQFGVPAGGSMDPVAAADVNRLLDNPPEAPVLELCLQGQRLEVLTDTWLAVAGASGARGHGPNCAFRVEAGDILDFGPGPAGVWTYLAVPEGFAGEQVLGSCSANPRAGIGRAAAVGDEWSAVSGDSTWNLPASVASRRLAMDAMHDSKGPVSLRVWPGPQWEQFAAAAQERLFTAEWTLTSQCDRVGYRLAGTSIAAERSQIISEPVLPGSIQVPGNGQPIVTMPDGPTIGGYPKAGLVDPADLPKLAQLRAGQRVRFVPAR